jgi:branched-chain amino acid transport system substrate-binding protein
VTRPSEIPPGGRALEPDEHAALFGEMAAIVEKSHLFKSLDPDGQKRVLESGYVCGFSAGDMVMRQGDLGDSLFLVLRGTVAVEADTPGGKVHLADLGRGAVLGEVAVLTGQPRTATVTATTDVDIVAFARHRIARVLADYPKVRELLESLVESRARDLIEKMLR